MNDIAQNQFPEDQIQDAGACSRSMLTQLEGMIRRHPVAATLASVGFGCAVGMVARALSTSPPPPQNRALRMLNHLQSRFGDLAHPAYDRASHLAQDGVHAMRSGIRSAADSRAADRLRHLFS